MKTLYKTLLSIAAAIVLFYTILFFSYKDPDPSCFHKKIPQEAIVIDDLPAANDYPGVFKSEVEINYKEWDRERKSFNGLRIDVDGNPRIDQIFLGLTNNRNCRVELWNEDELVTYKELGFSAKTEWPEPFKLSMEFFDQTNLRNRGKSMLRFRIFQGSDFVGSAGNLNIDLTQYGDFSLSKKLSTFSLFLDDRSQTKDIFFSGLKVWKNHKSGD